jgi:hypothetical protein
MHKVFCQNATKEIVTVYYVPRSNLLYNIRGVWGDKNLNKEN